MSDYFSCLSEAEKLRYRAKLCISGVDYGDPYCVDAAFWTSTSRWWPPITLVNITVYLLFTPSRFTADTLQAYKSLEAYNYFVSGKQSGVLWPDKTAGASRVRFKQEVEMNDEKRVRSCQCYIRKLKDIRPKARN